MKKRLFTLILAALLLSPSLFSCSQSEVNQDESTSNTPVADESTAAPGEDAEVVGGEERVYPDLPEDLNFDGHTFNILNNDYSINVWKQIDIYAEEMTGEGINDAVFQRNTAIQDKYNCLITSTRQDESTGNGTLKTSIVAQDGFVDIVTPHLRAFDDHAREGYYIELHSITSMDLSKPWYDQNSIKEVSVFNKLYGVATDITIMDEQATGAYVFNKQLYENHQLSTTFGNVYDVVKEGKWTLDTLEQMVPLVSNDENGDGKYNDEDLYGMLYQRDTMTSFLTGFNINIATKNADDVPEMTLMTDYNITVLNRLYDLLYQEEYCFHVMKFFDGTSEGFTNGMIRMFQNNQGLFMWIRLADVAELRTMETDFGILPMPKYSEQDTEYRSAVNSYVGVLTCIPICNYNPELTGSFIEALAAESRYTLLPEYYEVNLQGKVSRDQESQAMLDIIFSNRHYDLGEIYDPGSIANDIIQMTMTYNRDIASKYKSKEKVIERTLTRIVNDFTD